MANYHKHGDYMCCRIGNHPWVIGLDPSYDVCPYCGEMKQGSRRTNGPETINL